MLVVFKIIVQITVLILLFSIIGNYSFNVLFEINDYIYSFSSNYFFIVAIILFLSMYFCFAFYFFLKNKIIKYKIDLKVIKKEKGYHAFTESMIAISNKNFKKAFIESKKVEKFLSEDRPISLLLKSEILKAQKKFTDLEQVYENMIKDKTINTLGYRGLMELYLRNEDYHHALLYGEKLFENNPNIEKIYETLVQIVGKTKNWQRLINLTQKAFNHKIITKSIFNENTSIAYYEIAQIKKDDSLNEALDFLNKAIKLRDNFIPYAILLVNILQNNNETVKAKKELKKLWKKNPHYELIKPTISLAKFIPVSPLSLAYDLVGHTPQNKEAIELLVHASIEEKKWSKARDHIKPLLSANPSKNVCEFMAIIEREENNNIQISDAWKSRGTKGDINHIWICTVTKVAQNEWTSISKGGYFNSLQWKKPLLLNQFMERVN